MNVYFSQAPLFLGTILAVSVWAFFFVHAVQRIQDPGLRGVLVILFLFFNVFFIPVYIVVYYRNFYKEGKGTIVRYRKMK